MKLPWQRIVVLLGTILFVSDRVESLSMSNAATRATTPRKTPAEASQPSFAAANKIPAGVEVAIVGGGLGGLAACIALRNRGVDAHVFEAAEVLLRGSTGTGIMISPNGFSALDAIDPGLKPEMVRHGARIVKQTAETTDHETGETLGTITMGSLEDKYGIHQYNIGWARVHEILASSLPEGVVHCGCRFVSYKHSPASKNDDGKERVELSFDDGRKVKASLLVGADGFGSSVRKILAGEKKCRTRFNGQLLWNAIVPTDQFPEPLHKKGEVQFTICGGDGQAILAFDSGEGNTAWYLTMMENEAPKEVLEAIEDGKFGGFGGAEKWGARTALRRAFEKWPVALKCLEATPDDRIFERRQADRPRLLEWSSRSKRRGARGRVVLMGDAAHPMIPSLGQGTMVTWEDAAELAACLAPSGSRESFDESGVAKAVRAFVRRRARRCAFVQKTSHERRMGRPLPRFFPLKIMWLLRMKNGGERMYGYKSRGGGPSADN